MLQLWVGPGAWRLTWTVTEETWHMLWVWSTSGSPAANNLPSGTYTFCSALCYCCYCCCYSCCNHILPSMCSVTYDHYLSLLGSTLHVPLHFYRWHVTQLRQTPCVFFWANLENFGWVDNEEAYCDAPRHLKVEVDSELFGLSVSKVLNLRVAEAPQWSQNYKVQQVPECSEITGCQMHFLGSWGLVRALQRLLAKIKGTLLNFFWNRKLTLGSVEAGHGV